MTSQTIRSSPPDGWFPRWWANPSSMPLRDPSAASDARDAAGVLIRAALVPALVG
jgi:hypothetical protein